MGHMNEKSSTNSKKDPATEQMILSLKVLDYIVLRVIELCFAIYYWRIKRFVQDSSAAQRREVWKNIVEAHLLFKSKTIMGFLDAKSLIEHADLHEAALEMANPPSEEKEVKIKLPPQQGA